MEHMNLRIASINHPPYVTLNETGQGIRQLAGGIDAYVINILKQKFCFKYEAVIPPEPEWGKLIGGRWTGVIGMVYRNEVDLGISNMMITDSRYDAVNFSVPYNSDGWLLVSLAPRIYENKHAVIQPFRGEVWCALFVSVLISTCLLFCLQNIRSRFKWTPRLTWRNILWNVIAVLCQEGVKLEKIKSSGLLYFIIWIFSAMILQVSYGGTLIGFLTFPAREPSISNLKELADAIQQKGFKIAYKRYSLAQSLLESHEKYGELFTENMHSNPNAQVFNHKEGFDRVLTENFVFIANEFGCTYDSYRGDFIKLQMSRVLNRNYIAIAFSQNFQYLKAFNAVLRRLSERGLILKWKSDILSQRLMQTIFEKWNKSEETDALSTSVTKPLNVSQMRGAFLLLGGGYLLSAITLICEMLYIRYFPVKVRANRHYNKRTSFTGF